MPIPKHDEIRLPALKLLDLKGQLTNKDFELPLAKTFNLSEEEINQEYASGNGKVFLDRISWALSHLRIAGLLSKPKRGIYVINEAGRLALQQPDDLHQIVEKAVRERAKERKALKAPNPSSVNIIEEESKTPKEALELAFQNIKESIYEEILNTILEKSPTAFEKIVVKLLEKMGYGGTVKNAGQVTQATNDGGIDGIIKEDVLGLGRIHIQAKRYAPENSVGREEIQKFVGALAGVGANKGVFITTSSFTKGAIEFAEVANHVTLVLIDGRQLAQYIYDFGFGMQNEQTLYIRKMDSDYWDGI
ncbi:restriction endonuclease [Persicobacter diffluens]|uniref:Restriction endonuclease n=1 Tax=Persicobacter diffluens TaxID=981 RepID=A0AAN4VWU1_9BACT|nr:restriction endonuclease [Persicobacter diffluens]